MRKTPALLLAAGLALTGCNTTSEEMCDSRTREAHLGTTKTGKESYRTNQCQDLKNKEARQHCETLMTDLRAKMMSACMTWQKKKPMECKKNLLTWDCKEVKPESELKAEK